MSQQLDIILKEISKKDSNAIDELDCFVKKVIKIVEGISEIVNNEDLFTKIANILTKRKIKRYLLY